jgi:UDP-2-acetamido-2,6-beta-L-arabino-hexul-4-ose reductase
VSPSANPRTVVVTGSRGLIGWHVRCGLAGEGDFQVRADCRADWEDAGTLEELLGGVDAVVHLAGANRGEESEVATTNVRLAERLVHVLEMRSASPTVVYASSTHADGESSYGRSKRQAGEILRAWSVRSGARFVNLILPHVFGEQGRPFYNSVVSTFCHQLSARECPEVKADAELQLLHAQDVADIVAEALRGQASGDVRPAGRRILVSELLALLERMALQYREGLIPSLPDRFCVALFNTYRSYLYPDRYPMDLTVRSDARGELFEMVKCLGEGQVFVSHTRPGVVRGNHYHRRKIERFVVIEGQASIALRRLFDGRIVTLAVDGNRPQAVDIPTLHTHSITNTGNGDLITLFWANEIFDPANPDTKTEGVHQ